MNSHADDTTRPKANPGQAGHDGPGKCRDQEDGKVKRIHALAPAEGRAALEWDHPFDGEAAITPPDYSVRRKTGSTHDEVSNGCPRRENQMLEICAAPPQMYWRDSSPRAR